MSMLVLDRVGKRYPNGHQALSDVSFSIEPGELTFITGHSGAGKSTLLRLLMLIERASAGRLLVAGVDAASVSGNGIAWWRRRIGMVFQDHRLLMDRSVADNVALPLVIAGLDNSEIKRRVNAALDMVGLLRKAGQLPADLSGGEQQRVGIARAVVNRPPLLLADEPTGNLDPDLARTVMDVFEQLSGIGVTVLVATHDLPLLARYHHRLLMLREGRLIADGRSDQAPANTPDTGATDRHTPDTGIPGGLYAR